MTSCFFKWQLNFLRVACFFTDPFKIGTDVTLTEALFLFGGASSFGFTHKWKFALDSLERNLQSKH